MNGATTIANSSVGITEQERDEFSATEVSGCTEPSSADDRQLSKTMPSTADQIGNL
jgi:hypothetical protein